MAASTPSELRIATTGPSVKAQLDLHPRPSYIFATNPMSTILSFATRHRWPVIAATVALTAVLAFFAARVRIDTDLGGLLPKNAEVSRLIEEYGGAKSARDLLVVAIQGQDLFGPTALGAFSDALARISALPGIGGVISPFNLPGFTRTPEGALAIAPLSPDGTAPRTASGAAELKAKLERTGYARNLVVSPDGTMLAAFFQAERLKDYSTIVRQARAALETIRLAGVATHLSGPVAFADRTRFYISRDVVTLPLLAALVVLAFYWLSFRGGRGILLPFTVVLLGTLWSVGFMGILGIPLTLVSIVAPPLVLIFGNEYSIYVMNEYYRIGGLRGRPGAGGPSGSAGNPGSSSRRSDPRDAAIPRERGARGVIDQAVANVSAPILMAFLTTIVGFLTLSITDIRQTQEFALVASFGSLACGILALLFLPALLTLLPAPHENRSRRVLEGALARLMRRTAALISRRPLPLLAVIPALVAGLLVSLGLLTFNTDSSTYFPQKDPVITDMYAMTRQIGGFDEINITWTPPRTEGGAGAGTLRGWFLDPGVLAQLAAVEKAVRQDPDVCYSLSFASFLQEVSRSLGGPGDILTDRGALLYFARLVGAASGSDGTGSILGRMASPGFDRVTLSLRIFNSSTGRFMDEQRFRAFLAKLRQTIAEHPVVGGTAGGKAEPVIWGEILRNLSLADSLRRYLVISMMISYASIFALAALTFRSPVKGLYAVVPLACGLMLNFIAMAVLRIPLDMTTIMVANVTIGVGIDGGIYLVIEYLRRTRRHVRDFPAVIEGTLGAVGRAVIVSTAAVVAGLTIFVTAAFRPVVYFGLLVISSLAFTAAATLVVLPALLALDHRMRMRRLP